MESLITFEDSGKLIRVGDCLETNTVMSWLSASGTLSKSVISAEDFLQNLKKNYKTILMEYPTLRIKVVFNEKHIPSWYYASNEEIQFDNLIKIVEAPFNDEPPTPNKPSEAPLWRVYISSIGDKTKIRVCASHSIIDGRSLFDLLDLFVAYGLNKELNERLLKSKYQPVLYDYGKKDWFTEEYLKREMGNPYEKVNLSSTKMNPPVELPSHIINPQWDVAYPPISKFCKKHGVSPQAILMAIQNEAIRHFNKGKFDDIPVGIQIAMDTRFSPFATELYKNSLFFTHAGISVPSMEPEKDPLENIKKCANAVKDPVVMTQSCDSVYFIANMRSEETGEMVNTTKFPNPNCYVFASHIGLVGVGLEDLQFRMYSSVYGKTMYWPNLYGYHNKEIFSFVFEIPYNVPEDYFQSVKETSLRYYDFIVNDVKDEN